MIYIESNIWLIVIATVVRHFLGIFWYSSGMFGRVWLNLLKVSEEEAPAFYKKVQRKSVFTFILSFLSSAIFNFFRLYFEFTRNIVLDGFIMGALVGIGFGFSSLATHYVYEDRNKDFLIINGLYQVVSFSLIGIILSV